AIMHFLVSLFAFAQVGNLGRLKNLGDLGKALSTFNPKLITLLKLIKFPNYFLPASTLCRQKS
ncbi:MAG: hypothetical protein J6K40_05340, partial [Alistipes sp.]|nr:hypothetical protein [Alistipes sp.]